MANDAAILVFRYTLVFRSGRLYTGTLNLLMHSSYLLKSLLVGPIIINIIRSKIYCRVIKIGPRYATLISLHSYMIPNLEKLKF